MIIIDFYRFLLIFTDFYCLLIDLCIFAATFFGAIYFFRRFFEIENLESADFIAFRMYAFCICLDPTFCTCLDPTFGICLDPTFCICLDPTFCVYLDPTFCICIDPTFCIYLYPTFFIFLDPFQISKTLSVQLYLAFDG